MHRSQQSFQRPKTTDLQVKNYDNSSRVQFPLTAFVEFVFLRSSGFENLHRSTLLASESICKMFSQLIPLLLNNSWFCKSNFSYFCQMSFPNHRCVKERGTGCKIASRIIHESAVPKAADEIWQTQKIWQNTCYAVFIFFETVLCSWADFDLLSCLTRQHCWSGYSRKLRLMAKRCARSFLFRGDRDGSCWGSEDCRASKSPVPVTVMTRFSEPQTFHSGSLLLN